MLGGGEPTGHVIVRVTSPLDGKGLAQPISVKRPFSLSPAPLAMSDWSGLKL
jgi:hypothetical protein